jgi:hypothetical protein
MVLIRELLSKKKFIETIINNKLHFSEMTHQEFLHKCQEQDIDPKYVNLPIICFTEEYLKKLTQKIEVIMLVCEGDSAKLL